MHSLQLSFLSRLEFPAEISAGLSVLNQCRNSSFIQFKNFNFTIATLPDKKHVHASLSARQGYQEALAFIHEHRPAFSIDNLLTLHAMVFEYIDGSGGHFKSHNNSLYNHREDGSTILIHKPVDAKNIPSMMQQLIQSFYQAIQTHDPLVIVSLTLMDFILIHPFWDGNGRMFRLLSVLLLYQAGFNSARDLRFDHILQNSRGSGQAALQAGMQGWTQGTHDVVPWVTYCIGALSYAHASQALSA